MFITLTNCGTAGSKVYIRPDKISMIGVDNDGDTLVVYDGRAEYVKESPETVMGLIQACVRDGCKCGGHE